MSPITTHVLDTAIGKPAEGVDVLLARLDDGGGATLVSEAATDADGRVGSLMPAGGLTPGAYRLTFATSRYFAASGRESFYPSIEITFRVDDPAQHYHVPLLLSPFGYSTYRGS